MNNRPSASSSRAKLISQLLLEDMDLRDIVAEFVDGLGDRIVEMKAAYDALNWSGLATLAHKLKGAGGSYGYPDVSALARTIEESVRAQQAENFASWMAELEQLAAAARAGLQPVRLD